LCILTLRKHWRDEMVRWQMSWALLVCLWPDRPAAFQTNQHQSCGWHASSWPEALLLHSDNKILFLSTSLFLCISINQFLGWCQLVSNWGNHFYRTFSGRLIWGDGFDYRMEHHSGTYIKQDKGMEESWRNMTEWQFCPWTFAIITEAMGQT
jgi:hypothetical protein